MHGPNKAVAILENVVSEMHVFERSLRSVKNNPYIFTLTYLHRWICEKTKHEIKEIEKNNSGTNAFPKSYSVVFVNLILWVNLF